MRVPSPTVQTRQAYDKANHIVDTGATKRSTALMDLKPRVEDIQGLQALSDKDFNELLKGEERAMVQGLLGHLSTFRKLNTRALAGHSQQLKNIMGAYKQMKEGLALVSLDEDQKDYLARLFGSVKGQLSIAIRGEIEVKPCMPTEEERVQGYARKPIVINSSEEGTPTLVKVETKQSCKAMYRARQVGFPVHPVIKTPTPYKVDLGVPDIIGAYGDMISENFVGHQH